ncbi:MAG TPA: hypothetical protein VKA67_08180, partial [Verrucomicrobiae bacterium]|nr:hypothetical protein [Verrucomicrobiae bacterium]
LIVGGFILFLVFVAALWTHVDGKRKTAERHISESKPGQGRKLRKRSIFIVGFACLVLGVLYLWARRPSGPPSASIGLAGYAKETNSIIATVLLTNTGASTLAYIAGFGGTYYRASATTTDGETNYDPWVRTTMDAVVWPDDSARIRISLPLTTKSWRCSIPVRGPSSRVRMLAHLSKWSFLRKANWLMWRIVYLFPLNDSDYTQIQSDTFQISTNAIQ